MLPFHGVPASISVEVGTQPLPMSMRLASYRALPRLPLARMPRRRRFGIVSVMPAIVLATMAFGVRRGRRLAA